MVFLSRRLGRSRAERDRRIASLVLACVVLTMVGAFTVARQMGAGRTQQKARDDTGRVRRVLQSAQADRTAGNIADGLRRLDAIEGEREKWPRDVQFQYCILRASLWQERLEQGADRDTLTRAAHETVRWLSAAEQVIPEDEDPHGLIRSLICAMVEALRKREDAGFPELKAQKGS